MTPDEFRRQVFSSPAQWGYGLSDTLRRLEGGGVALFSRPAFGGWATQDPAALGIGSLAVDDCRRLFWVHEGSCQLYRRDPVNDLVEPAIALDGCGDPRNPGFGRLLSAFDRLWILDRTNSRLLALRPDTFQIIVEVPLTDPIDAAVGVARLFTLDADGVRAFDAEGRPVGGPYRDARWSKPVALGAGSDSRRQWIYVIDPGARGFLRYSAIDGSFDTVLGRFDDAAPGFSPTLLVVDPEGNLFASDGSRVAHEFAPDGGYIGHTDDVSPITGVLGLAVDARGDLYVGSPEGIARFGRDSGLAGSRGTFYTRTLDNGTDRGEGWHRVDLSAELDAGGALDVSYATSNDAALAAAVDGIFERPRSTRDRATALDAVLGNLWKGPQELRAVEPAGTATAARQGFARNMSHSVLFDTGTHRYLWIKLQLSGLAPAATAAVTEMRVYYPRLSYLRYLPAVYQQDPVSAEFLTRFLSMFETVFSGLEATIERIPEVFDPDLAPAEFLAWLAQWLDLGIEEDWPPSVTRALIQKAASLYQRKGTPQGLASFIEIVTGAHAVILESFETERPWILGGGAVLGVDSRVTRQPVTDVRRDERTILGMGSVLGASGIRASTRVPADPFRATAHRFTILLDLPAARFRRHERGLHRIIRENAPAHCGYEIRLVSRGLSGAARLGVNFKVADPPPMLLGYSALGDSICARRVWYGPQIGVDATLAGPAHEPFDMRDFSDGER